MFLITSNKRQKLLCLTYTGRVEPVELESARDELAAMIADLPVDFRVLADMSQMESMDANCATEIGRSMELIGQRGVSLIVRVIPDPSKDIGMNILAIFHYPQQPRMITCESLPEALQKLSEWA